MYQNLDMDAALREYRRLISSRLPRPRSWDSNAYDYRTGSMGRESSDPSYRSVIFYIQLSKKIVPETLRSFFRATEHYLVGHDSSNAKFNMLFLNEEDGQFLHPGNPCRGRSNAMTYTNIVFAKYADSLSPYAKKLNALFPQTNLYEPAKYPSKEDLCVLVTDEDDVELADGIGEQALRKPNRFIQIKVLPHNNFHIDKLQETDKIRQINTFKKGDVKMDNIIGRRVQIIEDKEQLKHNDDTGPFIMGTDRLSTNLDDFAGMVGQVVGYNEEKYYTNDGIYEKGVFIVRLELEDGKTTTVRAAEENVIF